MYLRDVAPGEETVVREIVFTVLREYGLSPDPEGTDADLKDISVSYLSRGGAFRVLESDDGRVVGCGGLYPLTGTEAEIRKMYLLPEARGRGWGRLFLQDLVDGARARGFRRLVLETASVLKEAVSLYKRFGFVPVEREHIAGRCDQALALELGDPGFQVCPELSY